MILPVQPRGESQVASTIASSYNDGIRSLELLGTPPAMLKDVLTRIARKLAKSTKTLPASPPKFNTIQAAADSPKKRTIISGVKAGLRGGANRLKHSALIRHWPHLSFVLGGTAGIVASMDKRLSNIFGITQGVKAVNDALDDARHSSGALKSDQYFLYYNSENTTESAGSVEVRRTRDYYPQGFGGNTSYWWKSYQPKNTPSVTYYYGQYMEIKGITVGDGTGKVQELIDSDPKFACVSLVQHQTAINGNAKTKFDWYQKCHDELNGRIDPVEGAFESHTYKGGHGDGWKQFKKAAGKSYGRNTEYTKYDTYYQSPDGKWYEDKPDFL